MRLDMVRVLLLGEGDFSFTHSLCQLWSSGKLEDVSEFLGIDTSNTLELIGTSLDSFSEILSKYPNFAFYKFPPFATIVHGVNALDNAQLSTVIGTQAVDAIVWNHPHLGTEDSKAHFELLCHFFHSVPKTTVVLSFLDAQLARWRVVDAANSAGFKLTRCEPLDESQFPSYECKRNMSGASFKSARSKDNWADPMSGSMNSTVCYFHPLDDETPEIEVNEKHSNDTVPTTPKIACMHCPGKSFKSEQGLRTHVRQVHELGLYAATASDASCDVCGKSFTSSVVMEMHTRNAHGVHEVKRRRLDTEEVCSDIGYVCEICGSTDKDHVAKFGRNQSVELFECKICEKAFKSARALNQHTNVVHPSSP